MGDINGLVNVWYWCADGQTQNLRTQGRRLGGGAGPPLSGSKDEGGILKGRQTISVAFAAWNGDNQERDGFKAVTMEW